MLRPCPIPGLFITGTDTAVGKTVIAAAIAALFKLRHKRVAVCKPIATGCALSPSLGTPGEGRGGGQLRTQNLELRTPPHLVSEDAEFLAHHADASFPLDIICPQRYAEPLAPAIAAERAKQPIDFSSIQRSINIMSAASDVMIVEGVGGVLVPLDPHHTVLDMIKWLALPVIIVARPSLGTINHTLLTLQTLRTANIPIAGIIINRFSTDSTDVAEQTNPAAIEKYGRTKILALIPPVTGSLIPSLPSDLLFPISQVDWPSILAPRRGEAAG
jgi:dethiobiotin synthetase